MTKRIITIGLVGIFGGLFLYAITLFGYIFFLASNDVAEKLSNPPCGIKIGGCYGKDTLIELKTIQIEQQLIIPQGKLFLTNLKDSIPTLLLKVNDKDSIIWVKKLVSTDENKCWIKMNSISETTLEDKGQEKRLTFYNYSMSEGGVIYLDTNYNFMYVCLSPM